jgi:glycosyltransferase involved in cell wall biosynthesis
MKTPVANDQLVSIIMPCYNAASTIAEAIDSVLFQSYQNFELIIIDNGSEDDTFLIMESYQKMDNRLVLLKNTDIKGVSYTRNIGIKNSQGRYICFLDADDMLLQGSLIQRVTLAQENSWKIVYGPYQRLLPDGSLVLVTPPKKVNFNKMLKRNYIGNLTGLYDALYFGRVVQEDIRHEDYSMWCKMLREVDYAHSVGQKPIGIYRVSGSSLSGNKFKAFFWRWAVLRKSLKINILLSVYYQAYYSISVFSERLKEKLYLKTL